MIQPIKPNKKIIFNSPCKVNLHLAIGEKRDDGFHNLDSIFVALDCADSLIFSFFPGNKAKTIITMEKEGPFLELSQKGQLFPPLPAESNIIYRATGLFRQKTGLKTNISVDVKKRIPPGSGLGGGSSNAAATLLALNELSGDTEKKLSREEMLDLAAQLGSDVPFFVDIALQEQEKSPARAVNGRGELLNYLPPPPPLGVLLVFPGFASNTGDAYRLLDENRPVITKSNPVLSKNLSDFSWTSPESWDFSNDFQHLLTKHDSERNKNAYITILKELKKAGAAFAGLSGSGSACFGIFSNPEKAVQAETKLNKSFYEPKSGILALQSTFFLLSD